MGDVAIENAVQGEEPGLEHRTAEVGANAEWRTWSAWEAGVEGIDATLSRVDSRFDCKPARACNRCDSTPCLLQRRDESAGDQNGIGRGMWDNDEQEKGSECYYAPNRCISVSFQEC